MGACGVNVALGDEFEEERGGRGRVGILRGRGHDEALGEVEVVVGAVDGLGLDVVGACGAGEAGDVIELGVLEWNACVGWNVVAYRKSEDTLLTA